MLAGIIYIRVLTRTDNQIWLKNLKPQVFKRQYFDLYYIFVKKIIPELVAYSTRDIHSHYQGIHINLNVYNLIFFNFQRFHLLDHDPKCYRLRRKLNNNINVVRNFNR